MRAALVVLSLSFTFGLSSSAQQQPAAPTPVQPIAPQGGVPVLNAPPKDDTSMSGVPNDAAQKAAQQAGAPKPDPQQQSVSPAIPGASAQTPANTIQRNVRLVVLDAVVVDAKGNAVTDLKREDFHITESGDPQEVRNFDPPGKYTPDPNITIDSTADLDRLAPRAPVNIVLLDEFTTRFEDMAFARYSLEKWLKKQPDKLDTPTMLIAVNLQKFEVLRDYTQNKAEILSALDHHFVAYPWQFHAFGWVTDTYAQAHLTLRRVAEASVGHLGHKNMIWLGRGFPPLVRSRITVDDQNRINSTIQITVNELRDARVTLYTIDPAGLLVNPGVYGAAAAYEAPFGGQPDFQDLARATGGRNLYGRNDVDVQIGTSINDGASFYTLTYRPTDDSRDFNKFRKIKVTVDRPGLTVVTRQGYFLDRIARLDKDNQPNRRLMTELIGAESSNMVYNAVPFTVKAVGPDPNSYMIHIESSGLYWTFATATAPRQAKIVLLVTTFDKKGNELKRDGKTMTANANAQAPPTGRVEIPLDLPYKLQADPKAVRARFVVRVDATGHIGTADLLLGKAGASAQSQSVPGATPPDATVPKKDQ